MAACPTWPMHTEFQLQPCIHNRVQRQLAAKPAPTQGAAPPTLSTELEAATAAATLSAGAVCGDWGHILCAAGGKPHASACSHTLVHGLSCQREIKCSCSPCRAPTNAANLEPAAGQGSQGRLGARARGLGLVASSGAQLDVQGCDAQLLRR